MNNGSHIESLIKSLQTSMEERFVSLEQRFVGMEERFVSLEERFSDMESSVNQRFEAMERSVSQRFTDMERSMNQRFKDMESVMNQRFADMEKRFDGLIEVVTVMQADIQEMKPMVNRIPFIERDIDDIKKVLTTHSRQLHNHEKRLNRLEARTV